jgi:hypothetical protein
MRLESASAILVALCLASCAATRDPEAAASGTREELALEEPPYFPNCVAKESGTYHQRKIDRHMWWPLESEGDPVARITDECVLTQP